MKVAFIEYSLLYESLGLVNLMGALRARGYEYKLFITTEEKDILESLKRFKPNILCFNIIDSIPGKRCC